MLNSTIFNYYYLVNQMQILSDYITSAFSPPQQKL